MTNIQEDFELFLDTISLDNHQEERISSAVRGLKTFLTTHYDIADGDVFVQGSYANKTIIKPLPDDEYDVDIVAVCVDGAVSADQALDDLEQALQSHGTYSGKVTPRKSCIRLQYADEVIGGFHVDVVPVRPSRSAPLECPRRNEGWNETAPAEYTTWCRNRGVLFARTVKALKRWRDEEPGARDSISSIVLQVLLADHIPLMVEDPSRLAAALSGIQAFLASVRGVPTLLNPVLPSENLAARWSLDQCNAFRHHLAIAESKAQRAVATTDYFEAAGYWREILGDDFPLPSRAEAGVELGDTTHAHSLASQGWTQSLIDGVTVGITAEIYAGDRRIARRYESDSGLLLPEWQLKFTARVEGVSSREIWWQVTNTGGHAREERSMRGEFFRGKAKGGIQDSADPSINWEVTRYTGSHVVEAFVVRDRTVIARSGPFFVNICNPRKRFLR